MSDSKKKEEKENKPMFNEETIINDITDISLVEKKNIELTTIQENKPLLFRTDLTVFDIQQSNLSKHQQEVVIASLHYPKIRDIDKSYYDIIHNFLVTVVVDAVKVTGIVMNKTDQVEFIDRAIPEICSDYYFLSLQEVAIAFKNGARKKYGDYYGINIGTMNVWLDSFIKTTKKEVMELLIYVKSPEKVVELTDAERLKLHKSWLKRVYDEYNEFKKTGKYTFNDLNNRFYLYCDSIGLITLTPNEKIEIFEIAKSELKGSYHPSKAKGFGQKVDFQNAITKIERNDKSFKQIIIMESRKIAIKYLFRDLVMNEADLKEVVEAAEQLKKT